MIHPDIELKYINDTIGYGVFATKFIPAGTITYIKDSLEIEISPQDFLKHSFPMQEVIEKYSYIDEKGYRIISWDIAKYVNHCCQCNTMSSGYGFEIAIRDIQAGEQVTDEYGIFNMQQEMTVTCGHEGCRGCVRPQDFDAYFPVWDAKLKPAVAKIPGVPQPLMPLMDLEVKKELQNYFTDPQQYKSVYSLKSEPNAVPHLAYNGHGKA